MSTRGTGTREIGWGGITAGAIAFIAALVCGIFLAADIGDTTLWLGLGIAFLAAGNLLGGVRTARQFPLGVDDATTTTATTTATTTDRV